VWHFSIWGGYNAACLGSNDIWVLVGPTGGDRLWPQSSDACGTDYKTPKINGRWEVHITVGAENDTGNFDIILYKADAAASEITRQVLQSGCPTPTYPGIRRDELPPGLTWQQTIQVTRISGTATPAVETFHNAKTGKYGLVEMPERFGGIELPEMVIVDAKEEMKQRKLQSHFTSVLLDELKALAGSFITILRANEKMIIPHSIYKCNPVDKKINKFHTVW
jgi:hypothetical protein